jgi:flagellar hook-associated protein 1
VRSSFFGFNVANTGLNAARAGLNTVAHNIANERTRGFSRQYMMRSASNPLAATGAGMVGTGVSIHGIGQHRNEFLDHRMWNEMSIFTQQGTKAGHLGIMENTFDSLSETGMLGLFDEFFTTLQDLTNSAGSGDMAFRNGMVQQGVTLTTSINDTHTRLVRQQRGVNSEIKATTFQINSLGNQIATLNDQISRAEAGGHRANDLRDRRATLIDELSGLVNVDVEERIGPNGRLELSISINNNMFVRGTDVNTLEVQRREHRANPTDVDGLYDIHFSNTGQRLNMHSQTLGGTLRGLIDIRDGNGGTAGRIVPPDGESEILQPTPGNGGTITMSGMNRLDFSADGGQITIIDQHGRRTQHNFTSFTFDEETGIATFVIDENTPVRADSQNHEVRVGETTSFKGIPHYLNQLNILVRTIAKAFNEGKHLNGELIEGTVGHAFGYTHGQEVGYGFKNLLFFSNGEHTNGGLTAFEYNSFNAANFQINPILITNPDFLATSKTEGTGISDVDLIISLIDLQTNRSLFKEGRLEDFVNSITSSLSIDVRQSERFFEMSADMVLNTQNQRLQVSGVDLNEEMLLMIEFQQLFQASARILSIIDGIYDNTINRMGA